MPTAYITDGYLYNGGTYMAYQLGRILNEEFDYNCNIIALNDERPSSIQYYHKIYPTLALSSFLLRSLEDDDILICNPSFSNLFLGHRATCKKVMYIQHFNTYQVIDGFFDMYICASKIVKDYIKLIYNLDCDIINPFIHNWDIKEKEIISWHQRPINEIFIYFKVGIWNQDRLIYLFVSELKKVVPSISVTISENKLLSHHELLSNMSKYRYVVVLSPTEGFGLVPLEAMMMGCTVLGFDGIGGLDYMKDGYNCAVSPYPNIQKIVMDLGRLIKDEDTSYRLSENGKKTASQFSFERFKNAWVNKFKELIAA